MAAVAEESVSVQSVCKQDDPNKLLLWQQTARLHHMRISSQTAVCFIGHATKPPTRQPATTHLNKCRLFLPSLSDVAADGNSAAHLYMPVIPLPAPPLLLLPVLRWLLLLLPLLAVLWPLCTPATSPCCC